eukprot:Polyplicarium_translucidae@DN2067_c0_g1_i2.p1
MNGQQQALLSLSLAMEDEKGCVADSDRDLFFKTLRLKCENRTCFECAGRSPTWTSLTYGVFLCLTCTANHRRLGTHISFVRSGDLDGFSVPQLLRMELGGNARARTYFRDYGACGDGRSIDWHSKVAARYRALLKKEVEAAALAAAPPPLPVKIAAAGPALPKKTVAAAKARPLDIDFDFDAFEAAVAPPPAAEQPSLAGQGGSKGSAEEFFPSVDYPPPIATPGLAPAGSAPKVGKATERFAGAKSISAADYFDDKPGGPTAEEKAQATRFTGATAISSDEYFNRADGTSRQFHNSSSLQQATQFLGLDEETSEQVSVLAEGAKQQLQGFAVTASQKVGKAREWLARNLDFPEGL